ncbi:MAG TPA: ABC transporter permease [Chthonomonadaceae bacterium]|nr:ABC transporter permease [Chthonomonadaceae bacterium]
MIADMQTMLWKEWKEILLQGGRRGKWNLLLFVAAFGIFIPWQFGRQWVTSPQLLIYWAWIPLFLVISVIADAFAGERERHTLETLLASRLSDRAILFGKVCAAVSYGWGMAMGSMLVGLVTVNILYGHGELLLYSPRVGLSIVVLSLLASILAAGAGVLISLRASTVRQAQQTLSFAIMALMFVPILGAQALPLEIRNHLVIALEHAGAMEITLLATAIFIVLDTGLLMIAMARFQRARLILD